jgi:hypothetical protein
MYTVTIIWGGAEIGFGEGFTAGAARAEALASVARIYRAAKSEWQIVVRQA